MNRAVDFLTQNWDYGPEVCMAAFAFFHSARVRKMEKARGKPLFWAESLVLTFFLAFGGGILAPFLLGKPPVMFVNDLIVPLVTFCWFLSHKADGVVFAFLDIPVVKQVIVVLAECFRANAMCGMVMLSNATLKAGKDYPIPLWGPIFLGTIAGCGGLFLPLDKGLKGLKNGAPWPLQSAFYGSTFFNIFVFDPYLGPYLRNAVAGVFEGDPMIQGKAIVAAFFCSCAILQTYLGPSFNPFTPIHNMLYMATGVPTPAQVAAAASAEKAKED